MSRPDFPLGTSNTATTTTSTGDTHSVLLRVCRDEGGYLVSDIGLGTCYGAGESVGAALADWVKAVEGLIAVVEGQALAVALADEVRRYRAFLRCELPETKP